MIWWLFACGASSTVESEAQRYLQAVEPGIPLEQALEICESLEDARSGECALGAMQVRGAVTEERCTGIKEGLWRDECLFSAAEGLQKEGHIDEAFALCGRTRFARECTFHVIRDTAQSVQNSDPQALVKLSSSLESPWAADAKELFWKSWHRTAQEAGLVLDTERCRGLESVDESAFLACVDGVRVLFKDASRAVDAAILCDRVKRGEPPVVLKGNQPVFQQSDFLRAWVAEICSAH